MKTRTKETSSCFLHELYIFTTILSAPPPPSLVMAVDRSCQDITCADRLVDDTWAPGGGISRPLPRIGKAFPYEAGDIHDMI